MVVGFEHESYNISESDGSVEVCVRVSGIPRSSLSVSLTTVDGAAKSEQSYAILPRSYSSSQAPAIIVFIQHFEGLAVVLFTTHRIISFAIASADYVSSSVALMFGPSSKKQCMLISALNDTVPEVSEHFSVVLSMRTPLAGVILTPDTATVVISDDDGECM